MGFPPDPMYFEDYEDARIYRTLGPIVDGRLVIPRAAVPPAWEWVERESRDDGSQALLGSFLG